MTSTPATPEPVATPPGGNSSLKDGGATPMSPAASALPPPSQSPSPEETPELGLRPPTPLGRKPPGSGVSKLAKANVRAAVRKTLGRGRDDTDDYLCLITRLSNRGYPLTYAHVVASATPSGDVSLLIVAWFMLLIGL